jgi:hypothetical protein
MIVVDPALMWHTTDAGGGHRARKQEPLMITIQTDADFTPKGKRTARNVKTYRGGRQLRWYVSGRIYHRLPVTGENLGLTSQWLEAGRSVAADPMDDFNYVGSRHHY